MGLLGSVASGVGGSAAGGSWLGPAGMIGGMALGAVGSIFNNERNLNFQKEAQDYSKWLNERTWEREDSAVQRRVADLRRAGLSPVLAAGSSAQTGSPIKIEAQNSQDGYGTEGAISGFTRAAQTQQTLMATEAARAQIELTQAARDKVKAETSVINYDNFLYRLTSKYPRLQTGTLEDIVRFMMSPQGKKALKDVQAAIPTVKEAAVDFYKDHMPHFLGGGHTAEDPGRK